MDILILKDGTIPIGVAKLLAQDVSNEDGLVQQLSHEVGEDLHHVAEVFTVHDAPYLMVAWHEEDGFDATTTENLALAFDWLNHGATEEEIATSQLDGKHWAVTVRPGDHEWYKHLFIIGGDL